MMECRDTGLPMNEADVFKAFCAWRSNAKDFAARTGLNEDLPVQMAQRIQAVSPDAARLMTLAMLISVNPLALTPIAKRFGTDIVATLDENRRHVGMGYTYVDQASDDVKGIAMASAIIVFDKFIAQADKLCESALSISDFGREPAAVLQKLMMPEARIYERLEGRLHTGHYPALEKTFEEKLAQYREARVEQNKALEQMGIVISDPNEGSDELRAPFEAQGIIDAPSVRQAFDILTHDARVTPAAFHNALSTARLLSELPDQKDPGAIAAGMICAGLSRRTPGETEFLAAKLGSDVTDILTTYDIEEACTQSAAGLAEAPPAVRQLAVAMGIILLDAARKRSEEVMEFIEMSGEQVSPSVIAQSLAPLRVMSALVPNALLPLMGQTGSRQLEQLFDAQVKDVDSYVKARLPETQPQDNGGRLKTRYKSSGPDFTL